jgi:hypothetical protein
MLRSVISSGFALLLVSGTFAISESHNSGLHRKHHRRHTAHHAQAQPAPTRVDVYNGATAQTQVFNAQPMKPGSKQTPAMTRVDVYNGSSKQMQVFSPEPAPRAASVNAKHGAQRNIAAAHPVPEVEILNGTTKQRRIFSGTANEMNAPTPLHRNSQPVVLGISSSGSDSRTKNASPVVTGIDSGSPTSAGPVSTGVSPAPPKRPPYRPAPLDAP